MRTDDIRALLNRSKRDFLVLQRNYEDCLHERKVSADLKIDIKNLVENLRSILDYLANDIWDRHCSPPKSSERFYFPILPNPTMFRSICTRWYPGLQQSCIDLWDFLESVQPYNTGYEWLGQFNKLNNENKHENLVEQTRTETKRVHVEFQGGNVNWNPNSVRFGSGVKIDGVPVDPHTQMPLPHPSQTVKVVTWVDFRFEGIDVSSLGLLKSSLEGIDKIVDNISKWL